MNQNNSKVVFHTFLEQNKISEAVRSACGVSDDVNSIVSNAEQKVLNNMFSSEKLEDVFGLNEEFKNEINKRRSCLHGFTNSAYFVCGGTEPGDSNKERSWSLYDHIHNTVAKKNQCTVEYIRSELERKYG
ncbi:hypothetical protein HOG21_01835 [bacterium]|jgi:hypothetical protein|nr:hypothetical protein [bacterium]